MCDKNSIIIIPQTYKSLSRVGGVFETLLKMYSFTFILYIIKISQHVYVKFNYLSKLTFI